jgi:hypothetical protein
MICAISAGARRQLTDTLTAPILASPNVMSNHSVLFLSMNAVAGADAGRPQRVGGPVGAGVELAEGDGPSLDLERDGVGPCPGVGADDVGDGGDGHGSRPLCACACPVSS